MLILRKECTMFAAILTFITVITIPEREAASEFFVETICDGEPPRTVKCPQQNVISTVWASYGRHHSDICVDDDQLINITCKSDYDFVLSMVQETCDDANACNLESNKEEYGDPPECQGVKKYLQMYYLCNSEMINKAICEFNPPENITCPLSQMIEIVNANYGRKDKWTCGEELAENDRCLSPESDQMVKDKCNGKNFCEVEASNEVFGNPCGETHKYLEVQYHCQAGKEIKETPGAIKGKIYHSMTT